LVLFIISNFKSPKNYILRHLFSTPSPMTSSHTSGMHERWVMNDCTKLFRFYLQ